MTMSTSRQYDEHIENDVDVLDVNIPMYRVVLYNDDYTTFDFVISILMQVFHKPSDEAEKITLSVHQKGKGIAGIYPREIAEMKVQEVHTRAESSGFPLRAGIEA